MHLSGNAVMSHHLLPFLVPCFSNAWHFIAKQAETERATVLLMETKVFFSSFSMSCLIILPYRNILIYLLCLPFQQQTVPGSPIQTLCKESHLLTVRCAAVGRSVNRLGVNKRGTVKGTLLTIQNYTVKIKQAAFFVPIFHPRGMYKKEGLKNVVKLFLK